MLLRTIAILVALAPISARAEICADIPAKPPQRVPPIQLPCETVGWRVAQYPQTFSLCVPSSLKETQLGSDEFVVQFERSDLLVTADYGQFPDDLSDDGSQPDFQEWSSLPWDPMWMKYVSFTETQDTARPFRLAAFVPNIAPSTRLTVFVSAKTCEGVHQGYDLLRSITFPR